jgi:hypothetical protein
VPLSTSNSNRRVPQGPWVRTWVLALVLTCGALCAVEMHLRSKGNLPSVLDDPGLWAVERRNVYSDGATTPVVLLGASRIQLGFVPEAFEQEYPNYHIVQLAITGSSPLPVLIDLANDENFNGIVVMSTNFATPQGLARKDKFGELKQQAYVANYWASWTGAASLDNVIDRKLEAFAQEHLVVFTRPLAKICDRILAGEELFPPQHYVVTHADRSRSADYKAIDTVANRAYRIQKLRKWADRTVPVELDKWLGLAKEMDEISDRIRARGGQVVYVKYITTGENYETTNRYYPKSLYWDRFAQAAGGEAIHFRDIPSLRDYECPDTSHLDYRDAPGFTLSLAKELERRGIIRH